MPEPAPEASGWDLQFSDPERAFAQATAGAEEEDAHVRLWSALMLATYHQRFGRPAVAAAQLANARRSLLAGAGGARARWLTAALEANQQFVEGNITAALAQAEALLTAPPPPGHEPDLHLVYSILSFCHKRLGNFEAGLRWLYTNLALAREHRLQPQLAIVLLNLSAYLMSIDEWRDADDCLKEAASLAADFDNRVLLHRIELNLALCARFLDDHEKALELTQRALAESPIDAGSAFSLYGNAASLFVMLGRFEEGRRAQDQAWNLAKAKPLPLWLANCHYCDAQIAVAEGRVDAAIAELEQAASYAEQVTEVQVPVAPPIMRLLAECYARQGNHERAYWAHQRFFAAHQARLGYTQQTLFLAERTRHEVETMRLERDRVRELHQQSDLAQQELAAVNANLAARIAEVEALHVQLEEKVIRDPLTGLFNRRYWDAALPARIAFAERSGISMAVAQIDLDHFKRLNDTHGHAGGDEVLRTFGALLATNARASDLVCRVGGEEFCILFEDTTTAVAVARLEEILASYSALTISLGRVLVTGLTFSAGVALFPADAANPDELVRRADARLYEAKRGGRARVAAIEKQYPGKQETGQPE